MQKEADAKESYCVCLLLSLKEQTPTATLGIPRYICDAQPLDLWAILLQVFGLQIILLAEERNSQTYMFNIGFVLFSSITMFCCVELICQHSLSSETEIRSVAS